MLYCLCSENLKYTPKHRSTPHIYNNVHKLPRLIIYSSSNCRASLPIQRNYKVLIQAQSHILHTHYYQQIYLQNLMAMCVLIFFTAKCTSLKGDEKTIRRSIIIFPVCIFIRQGVIPFIEI